MADQDENWSQEAISLEEGEFLQDQIWCERNSRNLSCYVKFMDQIICYLWESFNLLQMIVNSEIIYIM